jgi:tRNA threonylcarbamoyladenosine biosynthesis protein TsaE
MPVVREIVCKHLEQLPEVAKEIVLMCWQYPIWRFEGAMGAGKTTLIKEICKILEVEDEVQSPTFSIVNHYRTNQNQNIYHFDFYRLRSEEEAYDIGYEDYFYEKNAYCFLEWASRIPNLLPTTLATIEIVVGASQERIFKIATN